MDTKNLAIMFTDMKGFTTMSSTQSRAQLQHLLELQDSLMRPVFKIFGGRVVKTIGDAFMIVFESPTNAVLCGMKIQENILNHNAVAPSSDQFEVRIAINAGEVNVNKDGDVFGEAVNIASRIEGISEPNEVYFTESVYLAMNKNEIPTAEVGERLLKGIPQAVKVYKVLQERTTLIAARLKRAELAKQHAHLAKGEVHGPEADKKTVATESVIHAPRESFFQKHKKTVIVVLITIAALNVLWGIAFAINKLSEKMEKKEINNIEQPDIDQLMNNNKDVLNNKPFIPQESLQTPSQEMIKPNQQQFEQFDINPEILKQSNYKELIEKINILLEARRYPDMMKVISFSAFEKYQTFSPEQQQAFKSLLEKVLNQLPADSPQRQGIKDVLRKIGQK